MNRHTFLSGIHAAYQPRSYVEIGVANGAGLQRSKTRSIGVDPSFKITVPFECDVQMVRATSDDFFAQPDPIARFPEGVVDLTFIDGLHLFEFALRDFMNAERLSSPASVIVLDDMLPRSTAEAARDRYTKQWAGDVYKVLLVIEKYRPDLVVVPLDTYPTGVVLVVGLDPANTVLRDNYDAILSEYVTEDPQDVPDYVLERTTAADPELALSSPVWAELIATRSTGARPAGLEKLRELRGTADYVPNPPTPTPWPAAQPSAAAPSTARPGGAPLLRKLRSAIKSRL